VGRPWLAAVLASGLPRLPKEITVRLRMKELCTSAERLAWARLNGCSWGRVYSYGHERINPCALAASGGHLGALRWAREHGCPWDEDTCAYAAEGGHLEVLKWAREHCCPWNPMTLRGAAASGHVDVLRWAWGHCPIYGGNIRNWAANSGHRDVRQWAREQGAREQDCPWDAWTCALVAAWWVAARRQPVLFFDIKPVIHKFIAFSTLSLWQRTGHLRRPTTAK